MKVLHVIPGLTNSSGPTHALVQLVTSLEKVGVDVSVAYLGDRLKNQTEPKLSRGQVFACNTRYLRHWGYSPELRILLESIAPQHDLLHIHSLWLYPGLIASNVARRLKLPYIVRPAGSLEPEALNRRGILKRCYFAAWEKDIINNACLIHATSKQEQENIESLNLTPPCVTIPNGIQPEDFSQLPSREEARSKLKIEQQRPVLTYVGRIHPIKGLEMMAAVIRSLRDEFPNLLFLICGPDEHAYARDLKSTFDDHGVLDSVRFLGEVDQTQKILAYRSGDLALLPSKTENFGIVAAEALASETPVIASVHTPWNILEESGAGAWIPREPGLWAETIEGYLRNPETRRESGLRGRSLVLSTFAWPSIGRQMKQTYSELLHSPKTTPAEDLQTHCPR